MVQMYPNSAQRRILNHWFVDARKTWNCSLNEIYKKKWHWVERQLFFYTKSDEPSLDQKRFDTDTDTRIDKKFTPDEKRSEY